MKNRKALLKNLPDAPGVYLMKGGGGRVLYVGKAASLRRRVGSYFLKNKEPRLAKLVKEIKSVDHYSTPTTIEALILESGLIKKYKPQYNFKSKDDTSFWYVEITNDTYPRILLTRGKNLLVNRISARSRIYGPFTNATELKTALKIIRKIFPYNTHEPQGLGKAKRPCTNFQIGLCPGTCIGAIDRIVYQKNIKNIKAFLEGKKDRLIKDLVREMRSASRELRFEEAERIKRQLFGLRHIQDVALIREAEIVSPEGVDFRIEGYDISNISGTSAVGSMVVFKGGEPDKKQYRKFKIRTVQRADDVGMLKEVLTRRFSRKQELGGWPTPDLVLVDGGRGQVAVGERVMRETGFRIPVLGIAKGKGRKRNDLVGVIPSWTDEKTLIRVRDEAHRFAIAYHKKLRSFGFLNKKAGRKTSHSIE